MNKTNSNLEFRKIKSLKYLYEINENGTILRNVKSKKQSKIKLDFHHSEKGYYVSFIHIGDKIIRVTIHRAVAECWYGPCPDGYEVDHKDRNPHNNDWHNLHYVTHSEQMKNREFSERIISQAKRNCLNYSLTVLAKPVVIVKEDKKLTFRSMAECAYYISNEYGTKAESERAKLKARRKHIHDYDIIYSECRD